MIRAWSIVASVAVPIVMTGAYTFLAWSAETDTAGKAWMSLGLVFVLSLWWGFRVLAANAGMARAVAVGDTERVLTHTAAELARRRSARTRAPLLVYRALAFELRGEWPRVLSTLDEAHCDALAAGARMSWELLAAVARVGALVETGDAAGARAILDDVLVPRARRVRETPYAAAAILARLAEGRVRWREGDHAGAEPLLARVIDDVRAGSAARGVAHFYAARIADARGDSTGATRHRQAATALAPYTWVDGEHAISASASA